MDSQPVDEMLDTMQSIISARCAVGVFAANKIFDWTYDEYLRDGVDDIVDKVGGFAENVGDAVFDFFSGTAFA
ncbi:MAG: hypothetical protein RR746_08575 [Lachnospiraceae bacterium]